MNQVDCEGEDQRESREEREMVLTTVQLRRASIMDTLVPQVRMTTMVVVMVVSLGCKGLVKSGLFVNIDDDNHDFQGEEGRRQSCIPSGGGQRRGSGINRFFNDGDGDGD